MKKGIVTVLLMVIAVVFGVGLRYYVQTGSLMPQEQAEPLQAVEQDFEEEIPEKEPESPEEQSKETNLPEEPSIQASADNDWGVLLTAKDVTPDGMTLVCTQSGGTPTGELSTGAWYELEVLVSGQWQQVPILTASCWVDVAWIIPPEETTEWQVNWTWDYGTLSPGEYRIAKEIMDFRQTGDFDTCISYAYFTIE